mmetsp:Transcript_22452/g.58619  ORF Transcript_22452/g.58619 Transcript_22452/m.58619 type:complete len:113 (+) Transcript_22452:331-669(+)
MALGAQEFYPDGIDLAQFINKYKADLMNKHVLYIILSCYIMKANTKGDSNIYKIGKSTIGISRLQYSLISTCTALNAKARRSRVLSCSGLRKCQLGSPVKAGSCLSTEWKRL